MQSSVTNEYYSGKYIYGGKQLKDKRRIISTMVRTYLQALEYSKQYYRQNKEKINETKNRKYTCECGSTLSHRERARHSKTIKHLNYCKDLAPME